VTGSSVTTGPFRGVRVLELSRGQAARLAGTLLADLGADVVLSDGAVRGSSR
jgi:crotonobetainyl-CoA:carnitine CoA-transferase CaiB-like acyl-CoA transferase